MKRDKRLEFIKKGNNPFEDIRGKISNYKLSENIDLNANLVIMNPLGSASINNSINKNISIFFGVTAAILEALEKKINVIHICSDPIFQSYSEQIWPNFKVKQLGKFTFSYNLNSLGKFINFGKNNSLNQVLKAIS